jgi:hypothetical protein
MKKNFTVVLGITVSVISSALIFFTTHENKQLFAQVKDTGEDEDKRDEYTTLRWLHEFNMLKDPVLNRIPDEVASKELSQAHAIPYKQYEILAGTFGADNLNTYVAAGPNNIGGRTRAVAFDIRNSNIIISGCISGGIERSADGGNTWTRVTPEGQIHNFSSVVQDPRVGFQDTWYAAGGEPISNSASAPGAFYLSMPIWKSIDNGVTWTATNTSIPGLGVGTLENFDHPFDIVHKLAIDPVTGNLYVAGHRRLIRSLDGANTWEIAFNTNVAAGSATGQLDIAITNTGKFILAVNGGMPDATTRGVWTSSTGALNSWTRIAGGSVLNVDSVDGWKGNNYSGGSKRILIGVAPSNQNHMYVLYENGFDQSTDLKPEVDMYKLDLTSTPAWTNLSANMPDFPNNNRAGVDPIAVQGGYDMLVAVKPDDENMVFVGGTCLYRSTNGFTSSAATSWIGGYGNTLPTLTIYPNSHPDIHSLAFDPANPVRAICGNDGGIQVTSDITATVNTTQPVTWTMINNYQTLQYYHVAIDPISGRNNFIGGAQDNGSQLRNDGSDNHVRIVGGDGGAAGMNIASGGNQFMYCSSQLGDMYRATVSSGVITALNNIKPTGLTSTPGTSGFGDFVTYFKIDFDNPEDGYYVNFNRLFRTNSSSTVSSSGWTELTGTSGAVSTVNGTNVSISALESSRGDYFPSHALYIGTSNGRVLRLDNPRNASPSATPVDITPSVLNGLGAQAYISDIAANPNNDEELLAVVSNYSINNNTAINIWWTNNAKSATPTWKLAEGNLTLPSVRSAQIVVKKDAGGNPVTEYYVGTSVGLYSAINIATTLQNNQAVNWVREGGNVLNFAVITSLDYRPQDNVLLVGTHGNGIFYTNVGTPNYTPNLNTGVSEPTRNDKKFIQAAYPTLVNNNHIDYRIGNMFTIPAIVIQVYNSAGQLLIKTESPYQSGSLDVGRLPAGSYVLTITSKDYKQQFVQSFVKHN